MSKVSTQQVKRLGPKQGGLTQSPHSEHQVLTAYGKI